MNDELNIVSRLESKILRLIDLHQQSRNKVLELTEANKHLNSQLEAEVQKQHRLEQELETERLTGTMLKNESIGALKIKVNDIIREVDMNLSLINNRSKLKQDV